ALRDCAIKYGDTQQLRARIQEIVLPAIHRLHRERNEGDAVPEPEWISKLRHEVIFNSKATHNFTFSRDEVYQLLSPPSQAVEQALREFLALGEKHTATCGMDRSGEERFQNVFAVAQELSELTEKHRALI